MTNITKTNRFKTFRKKYRKDEAVCELLDYICLLEDQITELEKMIIAIEKGLVNSPQE